jgi:hypothetical protein
MSAGKPGLGKTLLDDAVIEYGRLLSELSRLSEEMDRYVICIKRRKNESAKEKAFNG